MFLYRDFRVAIEIRAVGEATLTNGILFPPFFVIVSRTREEKSIEKFFSIFVRLEKSVLFLLRVYAFLFSSRFVSHRQDEYIFPWARFAPGQLDLPLSYVAAYHYRLGHQVVDRPMGHFA